MKTMITRNNVPRHNGTMRCLLGRNGPREFRIITPRHGLLLRGSEQKRAEDMEGSGSEPGASGSQWKLWKLSGSGWKTGKGSEGVWEVRKRSGRGLEGCGKVRKRWEGTGSNGTLQYLPLKAEPSRP